jgi:hypothetical protein
MRTLNFVTVPKKLRNLNTAQEDDLKVLIHFLQRISDTNLKAQEQPVQDPYSLFKYGNMETLL